MPLELAIASGKGGVGKSTVSSTVAIMLARSGREVVAVDADADAPNLHLVLGVDGWREEKPYSDTMIAKIVDDICVRCGVCADVCTYDAVHLLEDGRYMISPVLCEGCSTCSLACPIDGAIVRERVESGKVLLADTGYGFPLVSARLNPGRPNTGKLVTEEKDVAKSIANENTIIVLDSAAGVGCQVISSLAGAHIAILVAEPTPASLSDLKRVHTLTKHFMMPSAIVINKYDIREDLTEEIEIYSKENGIEIMGRIPYDDVVPRSMAMMKPLIEAFPDSPAAKALKRIGMEVIEIVSDWRRWWIQHKPKRPEPYKPVIISPRGR